jgi:hypothetical protein
MNTYASNAQANANYASNLPQIPSDHQPWEVEIFVGDISLMPAFRWYQGQWRVSTQPNKDIDITQIRVDGKWAYITVGDEILLNRMTEYQLPQI